MASLTHLRPRRRAARARAPRCCRSSRAAAARCPSSSGSTERRRGRPRATSPPTPRSAASRLRDALPATYPHVLAFAAAHGADDRRAVPVPGGRAGAHRQLDRAATGRSTPASGFDLRVRPTPIEPHPKGRTFSIVTEARVGGELVWEGRSTMLRRGGSDGGRRQAAPSGASCRGAPRRRAPEWRLEGDLGRRYAAVSGDRNPIHMHDSDREAVRLPARDRARDVDEGALPRGAGGRAARRVHGRGRVPQADPAARHA